MKRKIISIFLAAIVIASMGVSMFHSNQVHSSINNRTLVATDDSQLIEFPFRPWSSLI